MRPASESDARRIGHDRSNPTVRGIRPQFARGIHRHTRDFPKSEYDSVCDVLVRGLERLGQVMIFTGDKADVRQNSNDARERTTDSRNDPSTTRQKAITLAGFEGKPFADLKSPYWFVIDDRVVYRRQALVMTRSQF